MVLLREIREMGYDGGYSTLKNYVHPRRRPSVKGAMMMDHRGGEKLYHLPPMFSDYVRANC